MVEKLFIIGNGFDLHHGISSRYSDFASYLKNVDRETFDIAEEYVVQDADLWSVLEDCLAGVDVAQIEEHASDFLQSYAAEDWRESDNHNYGYEVGRICDAISGTLRSRFADWVRQIDVLNCSIPPVKCIDPNGWFLNFNYTPNLQLNYQIADERILHIHGSAKDVTSEIILGHGWQRQPSELRSNLTREETDVRVSEGFSIIDGMLAKTFKPTREIIHKNRGFFGKLVGITEVFVLGHSLAPVDKPYFSEVIKKVDPCADWIVSYRSDLIAATVDAKSIGIPPDQLKVEELRNL